MKIEDASEQRFIEAYFHITGIAQVDDVSIHTVYMQWKIHDYI